MLTNLSLTVKSGCISLNNIVGEKTMIKIGSSWVGLKQIMTIRVFPANDRYGIRVVVTLIDGQYFTESGFETIEKAQEFADLVALKRANSK